MKADADQQTREGAEEKSSSATWFEIRLPGPLDISASLELFRSNGDDLLDRWDGTTLIRTLPVTDARFALL